MIVTESLDLQLSDLLNRIGVKLQITPTQHQLAEQRYQEIGNWLSMGDSPLARYSPTIYPQGSLRIGTTVKPLGRQEYDLDLVLEIGWDWRRIRNPVVLLDLVEARLRQHGTYRDMLERKNRCIRVQYANQFHLDILPACPDSASGDGCVVVPDREAKDWKPSNPTGYAAWFDRQAQVALVEMAKRVEPLPDWEPNQVRPPLNRAVQLLKRWRDIRYARTPDLAPISIVLTTLAGHHYGGAELVNLALERVVDGIVAALPTAGRLVVQNPSNPQEDLSERWDETPGAYQAFIAGMRELQVTWKQLNQQRGMSNVQVMLQRLFGEDIAKAVIAEQTKAVEAFRARQSLGVGRGSGTLASITAGSIPIPRNTFYGEGA
jgi:hypothetical protein